ncbi:hypothetical protein [Streptomyces sp.]|uniref:hypothetical protein n=1 Tax=Streptomyces sp. TaxID=1931 RepID=UPI002D773470|nr:hypothetical protein [Streptomyces sp.]HET6354846.1 hypothetical protein [Streptomyces sp.]
MLDADPYNPPRKLEVHQSLIVGGEDASTGRPVRQTIAYRRAVNPADEGPAWIYRYEEP